LAQSRTHALALLNPAKWAAVAELTKARLNLSVVYSALAGYFLGAGTLEWLPLLFLSLGGYLVVGGANGFNQVIERDRDKKMQRTQNRPIPTGRLSVMEAMIASTLMALVGLFLLYLINPLAFTFGAGALFIYAVVYTPLKAGGPLAVFVGAIPGAIPALLGWVAATNDFDVEPGTLFAIQFLWQFTHFWAIAWVAYDDYGRAGYNLLPSGKRDAKSARQIILYTIALVTVSILPAWGLTGGLTLSLWGGVVALLLGLALLVLAVQLARGRQKQDARRLMIGSVVYLPLLQLLYVIDKFI